MLLTTALATADLSANDDVSLDKLAREFASLKEQIMTEKWTDKVSMNGFASIGVGQANNDAGYLGYDEDYDFKQDSIFGLQMNIDYSEQTNATIQLVAHANDDWSPEIEWAFLSHELGDNLTVRGGKLRLPLFMLSDYLEVGYAYPFARPSAEVYGIGLSSYTGADMLYRKEMDGYSWTVQPFLGQGSASGFDVKEMYGLINLIEFNQITLRASYAEAKYEAPDIQVLDGETVTFAGLGFTYDDSELLVMAEYTQTKNGGITPDFNAGYLALAYRFDVFQPYLMVSKRESSDDEKRRHIPADFNTLNMERSGYNLGLRWDFSDNVAVKFDVTLVDEFGDTSGGLPGNLASFQDPLSGEVLATKTMEFEDTTVFSVVFDTVF